MTEYGRGEGSEPWHPEDPYGDGGWEGQQAHADQQSPYGGQPQHYPQQQPQYDNGGWGDGQQAAYGQAQQQYPQHDGQYEQHQQYNQQQYNQQQYDQQHQQQYDQQAYHGQQQSYDQNGNGWATGTQAQVPYPADPSDPYGQQAAAYGAGQQDYYGSPDAYPPPEPPSRRRAEPEPQIDWDRARTRESTPSSRATTTARTTPTTRKAAAATGAGAATRAARAARSARADAPVWWSCSCSAAAPRASATSGTSSTKIVSALPRTMPGTGRARWSPSRSPRVRAGTRSAGC